MSTKQWPDASIGYWLFVRKRIPFDVVWCLDTWRVEGEKKV
jgi:hypothetical protein